MGGGSDGGTEIINPPIRTDAPLQPELTNAGRAQLAANDQFNIWGAGFRLTPQNPFGQVYMPGPNQTIFGNPYNQANAAPFFGQSAGAPQNVGFNSQLGYPQNVQQAANQAMPPNGQQVLAPFQQFFPGIIPQFGVPQAYGQGQNAGSGQPQGGQNSPQQGQQQAPQQQGNWAFTPQQGQQQPQGQQNQSNSQSQQGSSQQQPPPPVQAQPQQPQMSPQEQTLQQQWINSVLSAGGSLPTNYQNGVFT